MAKRDSHTGPIGPAPAAAATQAAPAAGRIDAACAAIVAGRLAERELAVWARRGGVAETELRLLWMLCGDEAPTVSDRRCDQADYAARLAVSTAQVSTVVERLGDRGFIAAAIDPDDRRRRLWQLTPAGRSVVTMILGAADDASLSPATADRARVRKEAA